MSRCRAGNRPSLLCPFLKDILFLLVVIPRLTGPKLNTDKRDHWLLLADWNE